jgi:hypothetical protein
MTPKVLLALAAAAISLSLNALAADPQSHLRAMNLTESPLLEIR